MKSLRYTDDFINRHIGPSPEDISNMLEIIGAQNLDHLIEETIPDIILNNKEINLPERLSEFEYLHHIKKLASRNKIFRTYIGQGYTGTITPPVIQRNIFENPGWYTQYTPYQAEISQGRLEALLNFQTMVIDLTGLPIANASLLDEATAASEAMIMLHNHANKGTVNEKNKFFVSDKCLSQTIAVLKSRANPQGIELIIGDHESFNPDEKTFGGLLQYPTEDGLVADYSSFVKKMQAAQAFVSVAADILSLALLIPPGEWGADVVVGSTQRFGIPIGFGGPHAGYFSCKDEFKRIIPGRIIGVSIDSQENTAYRMALQTREQHIRREKATSNICTAQALLAIMAGMYAVYHGPEGIKEMAQRIHHAASALGSDLMSTGFELVHASYFDTLRIKSDSRTKRVKVIAENRGINFRYFNNGDIGITLDETISYSDLADIMDCFAMASGRQMGKNGLEKFLNSSQLMIDKGLQRTTPFLTHPVFNTYHSETELMRYIKKLENRDLSLTSSMIPLGSCTMKLNAAVQLMPVSWPEFGSIHPFVPIDQADGYLTIISELEAYLCEITGFTACSLQPNSGAQGEYAGLMVIRAFHEDRGDHHRNVALIPSSAHGTNPASAVMAGMKVVVVACDEMGNIDLADLKAKAVENSYNLACLMVTYPSTHGVFEESIIEVCDIIHQYGGLVYMDGANMNAQVGLTNPGRIGADVCHLNLHKTFAIPHGGGGPGMGPICVNDKLKPFLPGHPEVETGGEKGIDAVNAAPYGSASILLISYAYIRLLGKLGTTYATKMAILNANYIKSKLEPYYPILYVGKNRRVAHELILDFRQFKHEHGIEVEDIAKRLIDYGFHAPTVSFPVAGTLMVEPTESEPKAELDRFCDAMIAIRTEIDEIASGKADKQNNVLKNAPHTAPMVMSDSWEYPYSRQKAAYPLPYLLEQKFWSHVGRVNNPYGDRNLVCACPPIEEYMVEDSK